MSGVSAFSPEPWPEKLPSPELLPQSAPVTLMTLRVSTDSGRTWEPRRAIRSDGDFDPFAGSTWPPCECWRCRQA